MTEVELQQIGPCVVTELLRVSSTSSFYRGKFRKKEVVLQRLRVPLVTVEDKELFLARGKQLKKLTNRIIVNVLEVGFDGDHGYLVMQREPGVSLRESLVPGEKAAPEEVMRVLTPVGEALRNAHVTNVLHGNLHPGNLLLVGQYRAPLLTEFALTVPGMSELLDDEAFAIPYMAPEHLRYGPGTASDQYALAVITYEWLCGRRPYEATERDLLLQQQEHAALPAPSTLNEAISPELEGVLLRALSYDDAERFPTVQDFSDEFLRVHKNLPPKPVEVRPRVTSPLPALALTQNTPVLAPSAITIPVTPAVPTIPDTPVLPIDLSSQTDTPQPPEAGSNGHAATKVTADEPGVNDEAADDEASRDEGAKEAEESERPRRKSTLLNASEARLQKLVKEDLYQGGVLSQSLPGYEERLAQIEMASLVARSLSQNTHAIVEAGTGTGKALDVDTPIPTPDGWRRMGELVAGDIVFDEQGQPTRVTTAFDVLHDRPCYEVVFSDSSSLIADAEHEWASYTCADRKQPDQPYVSRTTKNFVTREKLVALNALIATSQHEPFLTVGQTMTLIGGHHWSVYQAAREIGPINPGGRPARYQSHKLLTTIKERLAKDLVAQRREDRVYTLVTTEQMAATLTTGSMGRANHAVAVAGPLALPEAELSIAPYFLGVWLGDGNSRNSQITTADPDLISEIEKDGYTVRPLRPQYLCAVDNEYGKAVSRWQPGMIGRLRTLGVLRNKHIPAVYLRASEQQRRDLLAGLLDTDGTVSHCGAVEFTTTSPQLARDVYELICSLGFRPSQREGRAKLRGKDCGPKWTLAFTTDQQVFRLKRKVAAQKERLRNYSTERNRFRYVTEVRKVPSRPVRCIQVDAPSHLYLAGRSMIPTHNSLAYLVPIVRSGKVAIVSTANKALQEQLFYKDIPFVQKHVKDFEAALVKGVGNYICLERVENERVGMQALTKNAEFKRLLALTQDPDADFNGDFETLGFPLAADIRSRIATDSDQCAWSKCDFYADCYVRQMRERAMLAQVIVVNHTLLLLDAALGGFLLPERDVIVLDEAHHLEEEATRSFTVTIGPAQIQTLLAQRLLKNHSQLSLQDEANRISASTWTRLALVADPGFRGRVNLEHPFEEGLRLATVIADLTDSLRRQRPKDMPEKEGQLYDKLLKRTQNLSENIRTVFSVAQPDKFVYYVERVQNQRQRDIYLQASAAPLDVTTWLRERLFDKSNVICTSATLATIGPNPAHPEEKGPNFGYFRRRVGLDPQDMPDVLERVLPLTFDYESNALLYIPRTLPVPDFGQGSDEYMKAIAREMYSLVKASRGRAFLLFSSKRMLERAYELMSPHLSYPMLKQGDMTRLELTRRFRAEEGAVLFGLKSFWEGVDIAGEALSLVVIDKLPFDPPDDPVHEARVAQMKANGENWFGTYVLPQAVLRLKQGLGRLLRTRDDRGVMAILDTRLHTKGYGKLVLDGLPPARRTTSMRDVERFFQEEAAF